MTHQELKDNLPLYVVGGLDTESVAEIEYHLNTDCNSCPDELREWQEVAGLLSLGATPDSPRPLVKERLLQRIRQESGNAKIVPLRPRRWKASWITLPLTAAAAILLVIGGLQYRQLATQVTTQAQHIEELTARTKEQTAHAEIITSLLKQEQEKLASREADIRQLTASLAEQHSASTGKSQQVINLEAALAEQQRRVATREQELARVREQAVETERELEQARRASKERLEYATAATAAQREIQRLRGELAQAQETVAASEREVRDIREQIEQQRTLVAASTRELDHLREAVARQRGVIEVLASPGVRIEYLRHAMPGLETEGHVLWNERKKAWVFYAFGMPQPEQGKEYQVWFMTEKEGPVSAGVFMPDQSGTGQVLAAPPSKLFGKITAVAVTLEPKGGLPKPSGAMYLRGSL